MSWTTIYKVPAIGQIFTFAEFHNSYRSAWLVWDQMGRRYLGWTDENFFLGRSMQPVWDLYKDQSISLDDRIVMAATFDYVMVRRENLPRLIQAIKSYATRFDPGTLLDQARELRNLINDEKCFAVCWRQTSVTADMWHVPDEEIPDEYRLYDIARDSGKHWFLFDRVPQA